MAPQPAEEPAAAGDASGVTASEGPPTGRTPALETADESAEASAGEAATAVGIVAAALQGGSTSECDDQEEEPEPMSVICYKLEV